MGHGHTHTLNSNIHIYDCQRIKNKIHRYGEKGSGVPFRAKLELCTGVGSDGTLQQCQKT